MITRASTIETIEVVRYVPWSRTTMAEIADDDVEHLVDQDERSGNSAAIAQRHGEEDRDQTADDRPDTN